MIEARELRIGNLVSVENNAYIITSGDIYNLDCYYKNYIQFYHEIPITEEWLVRLGFETNKFSNSNPKTYYNKKFDFGIDFYIDGTISLEDLAKIKYVHQLQNLYFALTGEELKLNDK